MEGEAQKRRPLHRLRLDVLNAVDVEEVVLVVIRDEPFHLLRAHPPIGLSDIDDRRVQVRQDVDAAAQDRERRGQQNGDRQDQHGNGPTQR